MKYVLELIGGKSLHSFLLKGKNLISESGNQNVVTVGLSLLLFLVVVLVIYRCIMTLTHSSLKPPINIISQSF